MNDYFGKNKLRNITQIHFDAHQIECWHCMILVTLANNAL